MQSIVLFLLVATVIGVAQSQSWAGTYTADSSCSTATCCCLSGHILVTSLSGNNYTISSSASGVCNSTLFTGTLYTNGYAGSIVMGVDNDTVSLSSDSLTINITDPINSTCSAKGIKSGTMAQHANIITLLALFQLGMVVTISTK
ncbi:unnamed protein product [Adineta steineri]|uniref:Uncharacterized protein n=1 Tax=Adineta steineri TaxID=433720 RepID=A0A813W8I8_9BILA|nr:unnamed protein product [Adineta steineri]CAF1489423.1 unnamed protein product [Adineta steineri]